MSRIQKIGLAADGVVVPRRMQPYTTGQATSKPAIRLSRLREMLRKNEPRICIVRGEGLGDVIMTTPLVHALKTQIPGAHLTYATNTKYLDGALVKALAYNPDIDYIMERQCLDDADFNLVLNLHCPCIAHEKPGNAPINRIDLFANYVGVTLQDCVPKYFIQKDEVDKGEMFLNLCRREKIILVQPSASNERRSFSHRALKEVITNLYQQHRIRSVIITHSNTDWKTDTLWDNIPGSIPLNNLDIREIAGIMVHCDLVLCPDSSILHLAGALGVPTVALFGPTHPAARINYYSNAVAIWKGDTMAPCPCWYSNCQIGLACWKAITPQEVINTCIVHLQNTSKVDIVHLLNKNRVSTIETEII